MNISKKDYYIAAIVGALTGIFAIPTLFHLGLRNPFVFLFSIVIISVLWPFGVWLGIFLSRWLPFMAQVGKFAAVGFLNTAIDFGVLNLLSYLSGVTAGFVIGGVNIPGFIVAVSNSYLWNKLWVSQQRNGYSYHDVCFVSFRGRRRGVVEYRQSRRHRGFFDLELFGLQIPRF
ncbi:MAG: GtrA family protein [Candidatus Azambacteria bacterium GW2011_GWC1_46_13]|uniref:GtrA family protein n=1 Tax=Candidatus Azambacteria bacterium GW2011_GWC1_46_13 TaxID=1618619 RepID=A0A0G1NKA2_9BACT|nr:MAG: GtrA family protein [Candidatus Azambacteria bacterium GW2011_GWC1_46_13]